jgi:hypothetical protein
VGEFNLCISKSVIDAECFSSDCLVAIEVAVAATLFFCCSQISWLRDNCLRLYKKNAVIMASKSAAPPTTAPITAPMCPLAQKLDLENF